MPDAATPREFDIVLLGATGFTGQLVAGFLHKHYGAGSNLTWAMAGRNQSKLEAVRRQLGTSAAELALLIADTEDADALAALAARARVICTTVGPYARYGSRLVAACAAAGTHYCDLTGEVQWMRAMIDTHEAAARDSGARIVHTCGFDSIPSDLGVYFIQQAMRERFGRTANRVSYRLAQAKGGFSGGTADSLLAMQEQADQDPQIRQLIKDPYALNPDDARQGLDGPDSQTPSYDEDFRAWTAPFVMAPINTRVVRRSNALMNYAYGRDFRYDEAVLTTGGPLGFGISLGVSLGFGTLNAATAFAPTRSLVARFLPKPGEGPSEAEREAGFFRVRMCAWHTEAPEQKLFATIEGDRDPGYAGTAKMLGESAVCLAQDDLSVGGGFWTPASAMGDALLERLPANAGVTFTLDKAR